MPKRLTDDEIRSIRVAKGLYSQALTAAIFHTSQANVSYIWNGHRRASVPGKSAAKTAEPGSPPSTPAVLPPADDEPQTAVALPTT